MHTVLESVNVNPGPEHQLLKGTLLWALALGIEVATRNEEASITHRVSTAKYLIPLELGRILGIQLFVEYNLLGSARVSGNI